MTSIQDDVTSRCIQLTELKSLFYHMMRDGYSFEEVKKIYMKIKALEAEINYINWRKEKHLN